MKMKVAIMAALAALLTLATAVSALAPKDHVLHEKRRDLHGSSLVKRSFIDPEMKVPVRIGLAQHSLGQAAELLSDISNPRSARYGKHLSQSEVQDLFTPTAEQISAVKEWATSVVGHNAIGTSKNKHWVQFEAKIADLERLLYTQFHEYETTDTDTDTGNHGIGCDKYFVPRHIQKHIDFITPGVKTLERKQRDLITRDNRDAGGKLKAVHKPLLHERDDQNSSSACGMNVTPDCIRKLYNVTDDLKGNPSNSIGVFETSLHYLNRTDMRLFLEKYTPNIPSDTFPDFVAIDGAPAVDNVTTSDSEANLDFQMIYPLTYPDKVIFYAVDDYVAQRYPYHLGLFNTFLDALDGSYCTYSSNGETGDNSDIDPIYPDTNPDGYNHPEECGTVKSADVISISYGIAEDSLPLNYQLRQCNEWMKLGLMGVSVFAASGDRGVSPRSGNCGQNGTLFGVQAPQNCPYITVVGGTMLPTGAQAGKDSEEASVNVQSGGGFSNVFPTADYQSDTVAAYFRDSPPPYAYYNVSHNASHTTGVYNRGGRAFPDVAACAQNLAIYLAQTTHLAQGTSGSAPIFAGIISRINSLRYDAGKGPLGFLNPVLYQNPGMFNDITSGINYGCMTKGFSAVKGWDPVTGLGTPDYGKMKEVLVALP